MALWIIVWNGMVVILLGMNGVWVLSVQSSGNEDEE
jgi:hypothetical protein